MKAKPHYITYCAFYLRLHEFSRCEVQRKYVPCNHTNVEIDADLAICQQRSTLIPNNTPGTIDCKILNITDSCFGVKI